MEHVSYNNIIKKGDEYGLYWYRFRHIIRKIISY